MKGRESAGLRSCPVESRARRTWTYNKWANRKKGKGGRNEVLPEHRKELPEHRKERKEVGGVVPLREPAPDLHGFNDRVGHEVVAAQLLDILVQVLFAWREDSGEIIQRGRGQAHVALHTRDVIEGEEAAEEQAARAPFGDVVEKVLLVLVALARGKSEAEVEALEAGDPADLDGL